MQHSLLMFIKWSSLQKGVSKSTPKSFMRLTPGVCLSRLEELARDKHSSLLRKLVNYMRKKVL